MIDNVSIQLQKAIYQALSSTGYSVYETKQANPIFPFIEIGQEIQRDVNTKSHNRTFHFITLHTFSKSSGSAESKILNQFVKKSILELDSVESFGVDFVKFENGLTLTETDANTSIWHGVLQFEIVLTKL